MKKNSSGRQPRLFPDGDEPVLTAGAPALQPEPLPAGTHGARAAADSLALVPPPRSGHRRWPGEDGIRDGSRCRIVDLRPAAHAHLPFPGVGVG